MSDKGKGDRAPRINSYREELDPINPSVMQQCIVPIAVPVLEEDPIELVVIPGVRCTQVDSHVLGRIWVNEEIMHTTRLDRDLAIFWGDATDNAVHRDTEYSILDAEVLSLKLVKMRRRTLWSIGTVDELAQVLWDRSFNSMAVCLAEEKTTAWWRFEEFGGEQATKSR